MGFLGELSLCCVLSEVGQKRAELFAQPFGAFAAFLCSCYLLSSLLTGTADRLAGYEPCENPCNRRKNCEQDLSKTLVWLYEDRRNKRNSRTTEDKSKGPDNY